MRYNVQAEASKYKRNSSRRKSWRNFVRVMACIVVFCTTYALILPAITLEQDVFCGLEEHTHSESCYVQENAQLLESEPTAGTAQTLVCSYETLGVHVHTAGCWNGNSELVCGYVDYVVHQHDDSCRNEAGELVCQLPEAGIHSHGEDCYQAEEESVQEEEPAQTEPPVQEDIPAQTEPPVQTEPAVQESHTHDETCYAMERGALICELPEAEAHVHEDACYVPSENTLCGLEEKTGHKHGEQCSETVLVCENADPEHVHDELACWQTNSLCELPEEEGHTHGAECYELVLSCELSGEAHQHTDECYEQIEVLICEVEEAEQPETTEPPATEPPATEPPATEPPATEPAETEPEETEPVLTCTRTDVQIHTHSDGCFSGSTWVCGIPEVIAHSHSEACFEITETTEPAESTEPSEPVEEIEATELLTCEIPESEEHQHSALCYGTWILSCELQEHTHELLCHSDPTADVETPAQWERTFSEVALTGDAAVDVLAIAKTQLGYEESTKNYEVTENGNTRGYTRYGDWYGIPYGDWCAMFVSFCLDYAQVADMPLNSVCANWIQDLTKLELYHKAADYMPVPGDLIFFDWEVDGHSDHVGLVAEIIPATDTEAAQIKTIEGNSSDRVQYVQYDLGDRCIMGYGELPGEQEDQQLCGMEEHTHGGDCYDSEGSLTCRREEHTHNEECLGRKLYYTDGSIRALVTIQNVQNLPTDLTLEVWQITEESDPETHGSMQVALSEQMASETQYVSQAAFYQMQLLSGGAPYELPAEASVTVNVEFTEPVFEASDVADSVDMHTYTLTPNGVIVEEEIQAIEPAMGTVSESGEASAEASDEEAVEEEAADTQVTYQAESPDAEEYENAEQGVTSVTYQSNSLTAFAVALATETQTGQFWTRVTSTADLTSDGTYMIVSAQGNYALRGAASGNNYTAVRLQTIKGNTGYYTIDLPDGTAADNTLYWRFSGSGSKFTIQNQNSSRYLYLGSSLIDRSSRQLTLSYQTTEKCWRIAYGNYYLRNVGTGSFTASNANDGTNWSKTFYYTRDVLIFKMSDVTSLDVPSDVTVGSSGSLDTQTAPSKPNYGSFITPSGSQTGDTAVTDSEDSTASVAGKYYSDPATSDIEAEFRRSTFADSMKNDGKILTDKSVIYGGDDYSAFSQYGANTFGVTLSALGQEYPLPQEDVVATPVDVVFVLDVSGSMTSDSTTGSTSDRAHDMTAAVNDAMYEIFEQHEANRVGIVLYSGGAWRLLPLGRYTADNNQYLTCTGEKITHSPTGHSDTISRVYGSASLKDSNGKSYANVGKDAVQGFGTYTQAGIALGREVFRDIGDDTTYTATIGTGELQREYTVNRQPVMILLSDGEPTYATNIYMDVQNGPHYGDGSGAATNAKGILGYYTILSANYYKRMISIHYDQPALFFTIGMGITAPEDGDGPYISTSNTGDNYKRAVLNPTQQIIQTLTSSLNADTTTTQLKNLLNGSFTEQAVNVTSTWPENWTGIPHTYVPVLQGNPYAGNYSYADGAYFGEMTPEELSEIFTGILEDSLKTVPYGFILYRNSSVDLTDQIGVGMEIKGTPVLRYAGQNYSNPTVTTNGNVTQYTYSGTYTDPYIPNRTMDLSEIIVTVTTDDDGNQTVDMFVPDTVLPTYTPELIGQEFYYESLPVRLIYQVGLTEESEAEVLALQKTGGSLTFYTNRWETEAEEAISTLLPSTANPFYFDVNNDGTIPPYQPHHTNKSENTTNTSAVVVDCSMSTDEHEGETVTQIVHKLGNNGKLVFEADTVSIPVEKKWAGVNAADMDAVDVSLYKIQEAATESGTTQRTATLVETITLSNDNQWTGSFTDLAAPGEDWYYAVLETVPNGYVASYGGEIISVSLDSGAPVTAAKVTFADSANILVTITNSPGLELPETGGPGTISYTMGGLLLIAAGFILLYIQKCKRREEDFLSS